MKDYNKNKKSSYLKYWDINNLHGRAMLQNFLVINFKRVEYIFEFDESFIKNHNEERDKGYFLEGDIQYPENLHTDLPVLAGRMKIEKVEKLVANLQDKNEYIIHIRSLKQTLNHGIVLKKI